MQSNSFNPSISAVPSLPQHKRGRKSPEIKFNDGNDVSEMTSEVGRISIHGTHDTHAHGHKTAKHGHHPAIVGSPERAKDWHKKWHDLQTTSHHTERLKLFDKNRGITGVVHSHPPKHTLHQPIRRHTVSEHTHSNTHSNAPNNKHKRSRSLVISTEPLNFTESRQLTSPTSLHTLKKATDSLFKDARVRKMMQHRKLLVTKDFMDTSSSPAPDSLQNLNLAADSLQKYHNQEALNLLQKMSLLPESTLHHLPPEEQQRITEERMRAVYEMLEHQRIQRDQFQRGLPVSDVPLSARPAMPVDSSSHMSIEIPTYGEMQARAQEESRLAEEWLKNAIDSTVRKVWMEVRSTSPEESDGETPLLSARRRSVAAPREVLPVEPQQLQSIRDAVWQRLLEYSDSLRHSQSEEVEQSAMQTEYAE
jgi:hypothetical protein